MFRIKEKISRPSYKILHINSQVPGMTKRFFTNCTVKEMECKISEGDAVLKQGYGQRKMYVYS